MPAGFKFTYPTLKSGRRIMIHTDDRRDMWSWMDAFEPGLWLLLFGTSVAVALAIALAELPWLTMAGQPVAGAAKIANLQVGQLCAACMRACLQELLVHGEPGRCALALGQRFVMCPALKPPHHVCRGRLQWASLAVAVRAAGQLAPRSPGGRMMGLAYAFLALILAHLYVASNSAQLIQRSTSNTIRCVWRCLRVRQGRKNTPHMPGLEDM